MRFVPLRVREGDDASCLNLSVPTNPRLVGVELEELASRGAFGFDWSLLEGATEGGAIPAMGDAISLQWTMHLSVGDTVAYTDERGETFDIEIVGSVPGTILQGQLFVDERHLTDRYPSDSGYRMFLIDAPEERAEAVAAELTRGLADVGLEVTTTTERLNAFGAVQNTYLVIFQLLGGLGLLLGSAGLGVVVLRNVMDRRGELAVQRALGYSRRAIRHVVWSEHAGLLLFGVLAGALPALVAVLPARSGDDQVPLAAPLLFVALVALSGALWVTLATRAALSGPLADALRND